MNDLRADLALRGCLMKVLFAICAAWCLRACYLSLLADRIEAWAGIDYDPNDEFKWGGTD